VKPVLFITGHVPAYRAGALERLHAREEIEVALFGGRSLHGGAPAVNLPFPHVQVAEHELWALARSGRHRAVVCSTAGRLAPLAGWNGARLARLPVILWSSLWAHPRTAAHALSYPLLLRLYRSADAVVTYGPHVSAYVRARGARNVHEAPQSVDNAFWGAPGVVPAEDLYPDASDGAAKARFLFVARPAPEKGLDVLLDAWRAAIGQMPELALAVAGGAGGGREEGVLVAGALDSEALRSAYEAAEVLLVPSVASRTFREPWGLVVNEAMNRGLAVIASDAVGAAAGGLVRDGANGLIVPAGSVAALTGAILRLAGEESLRARMGEAGRQDVLAYSHEAWAEGFSRALATVGLSRGHW
jgi:glycosyltransferase involved in cell wall biosynthesis